MTAVVDDAATPPATIAARIEPGDEPVAQVAALLGRAARPLIIAGDGVARSGAVPALVALAEQLGARVHGEPIYRRTNFPGDHALWRGGLYPAPAGVRKALDGADVVLIVGASAFTWFLYSPGEPFAPGVSIVQVDDDARQIGRSYPVTLGLLADPRAALEALSAALGPVMDARARAAAAERGRELATARHELVARLRAAAESERERTPISPAYLMHVLGSALPDDAIVVDESASSLPHVLRHLPFKQPGAFFGSKTGTLGWAAGAALGVQLASPERKVVATIGDGSLMYAPQALWTAAHRRLPITYVVPNNASYAILKSGMLTLGLDSAKRGVYPGMDLIDPEIDDVGLARALGVRAERVDRPKDLRDVLAACLAHPGPALVDVAIDRGFKAMA
jgi:benzoylformate decarboxylase